MAQTTKNYNDYWLATFGEVGQNKTGVNAIEVGALSQDGAVFQRLPIGTSAAGTAVKVDLISAEVFSVSVGTITTLVAGTLLKVGTVNYLGTLDSQTHGTQELLGTANYLGTVGTIVGTLAAVGTIAKVGTVDVLTAGTLTSIQGGTIGNLASGSVVVTAGTVTTILAGTQELMGTANYLGTVGTIVGTLANVGTLNYLGTIGTIVGTLVAVGTVDNIGTLGTITGALARVGTVDYLGTVGTVTSGEKFTYFHYTIGSGTIKAVAGFVHAVTVNTGATAPITLYDAIGTAAGTIATLAGSVVGTYLYDVSCATGITLAGTIAAACDITVAYK